MNDETKSTPDIPRHRSQKWFWLALVSPAVVALLSFVVGNYSKDTGVVIGFLGLIIGLVASFYCAYWLVWRFCKTDNMRIFFGILIVLGLGFVNFMIICFGCAGNLELIKS